jgi:hypothetical protein
LVDVTQASEQVSTSYVDVPGVRASGTIDADGSVELTGSRTFEYAGGYPAKYEFTLALAAESGGERLRGTGTWTVQGRPRPDGGAEVTCTRPMTVDYVSHTKPLAELAALSCSQEATLRPQPSGTLALIRFRNARSTGALGVSVIDEEGRRHSIGTLDPGREGWVWSLVTIPWVITDASGACVAVYMPTAEPSTATLR